MHRRSEGENFKNPRILLLFIELKNLDLEIINDCLSS